MVTGFLSFWLICIATTKWWNPTAVATELNLLCDSHFWPECVFMILQSIFLLVVAYSCFYCLLLTLLTIIRQTYPTHISTNKPALTKDPTNQPVASNVLRKGKRKGSGWEAWMSCGPKADHAAVVWGEKFNRCQQLPKIRRSSWWLVGWRNWFIRWCEKNLCFLPSMAKLFRCQAPRVEHWGTPGWLSPKWDLFCQLL